MIGRDDLIQAVPKLHRSQPDLTLERLIAEEEPRLGPILLKLPLETMPVRFASGAAPTPLLTVMVRVLPARSMSCGWVRSG